MNSNDSPREYLQTEDPSLVKDTYSKALLAKDINQYKQHLIRRRQFERSKIAENEINSMKKEINNLKDDMGEIKGLLQKLIDKV